MSPRRPLVPALSGALVALAVGCSSQSGLRRAGPQSGTTPSVAVTTSTSTSSTTSTTAPPPTTTTSTVPPLPTGPLSGPWRQAAPGIAVSVFHAPAGQAVGVALLDPARVRLLWMPSGAVPSSQRPSLVAACNGGFQFGASAGGWYANQRVGIPLRSGAASLVIYANGTATVGQWGRDAGMAPNVAEVRQNLTLLVDHGALTNPYSGAWGATITHTAYTSRSGLGVDQAGRLIYAGGSGLDPTALARVLIAAGAVRAMELDINPSWVTFEIYGPGAAAGSRILPTMVSPPFLTGYWRDFIAVFVRQ